MALKGGTLDQLAGDYKTTGAELQKLNPSLNMNTTYSLGEVKLPQMGGTAPTQPTGTTAPSTGLSKVATQGVGPDGQPIYDVFSGAEHIKDPSDPRLAGQQIANLPTGTAPVGFQSKFQQGFEDANSQLGEAGMDVDGATGSGLVGKYAPSTKNDFSSMFVQNDEMLNNLVKTFQEFTNPANQRESLRQTYDTMLKDSGVEAIDLELVDMKKVIEGSEDDLRTEITKAGGFATDSQVQALTNARNKQLIKNYNTLLDTRNAKEKYLTTAMGLEQADRQSADQRFESAFSMGTQIAQIQQQMQTNARSQMQWLATNMGMDGLYEATGGDQFSMGLVEQTLGLPQGGLFSAAQQARQVKLQTQEKEKLALEGQKLDLAGKRADLAMKPLDAEYKQAQISNMYSEIAKRKADNTIVFDQLGKLVVKPEEALKINKEMVNSDAYKGLTKAKDSLQYLKQFEDTFSKTGATSAVFSPRDNAKLKAEYNTAILNLKEFFNLGVLNGPDEAILRSVLPDPTNRSAALTGLSLGIYKPSTQTKAGIDNMKKMIEASLDDKFKSLSSQYGDYSSYSVNGLKDLNRVYVEQKAKLNPNIEKLIKDNPNLTPDDVLMILTQ